MSTPLARQRDLSLFQMMEGLDYAFPRTMREFTFEKLRDNRSRVADRLGPYLKSKRRIPFNLQGIFRHYPELDR
jgi:glutathione S-transferase